MRKGLGADAAVYRCSACHGDKDWVLGHPSRGRPRSLSASPALASTKEFRYHAAHPPPTPLPLSARVSVRGHRPVSVCTDAPVHG